jgi:hypothetical protein
MSQMGQKRINHHGQKSTVGRFGPKAENRGRGWIVSEVPLPDIATMT